MVCHMKRALYYSILKWSHGLSYEKDLMLHPKTIPSDIILKGTYHMTIENNTIVCNDKRAIRALS